LKNLHRKLRNAKIITIILHGFIIIAAGHGVLIMLLSDVLLPFFLVTGDVELSFILTSDYSSRISFAILTSLIGKLILIVSLFLKNSHGKQWLSLIGLMFLVVSLGFLTFGDWSYDSLFILSFASGIPFLLYLGRILFLIYRTKNHLM